MILDTKKISKKGEIIIPPFHNGHLGFMPGNFVSISTHYSERGENSFKDCELFIDQFQTNNTQQLFRLDCTLKDRPGVVGALLNAISFFEINIISKESSAVDSMYFHHVSMILDWTKSNRKTKEEVTPSSNTIYGKYFSLIPNNDNRYLELFEKILAYCGDQIKIKGGLPEITFSPYDIAEVSLTDHFHEVKKMKNNSKDKFYVSINIPSQILIDIKKATGYSNKEEVSYIALSDTDKKFLRVFIPKKSRSKRLFHIGFSHIDEPGALATITRLLALKGFNIYSCLLRRDNFREESNEKRNIWEAILESEQKIEIPNGYDLTEWLLKELGNDTFALEKDIEEWEKLKMLINFYRIFICPPKYPKKEFSSKLLKFKDVNENGKRHILRDFDFKSKLDNIYQKFNNTDLGPNDSVRFDLVKRIKKQTDGANRTIFLSYPGPAHKHADYLKKMLVEIGFDPIELQETLPGKDITDEAIDLISRCDFFIGIWHHEQRESNFDSVSPWMPFEFGVARTLRKKIILLASDKLDKRIWNRIDSGLSKLKYSSLQYTTDTIDRVRKVIEEEWK